MIEVWEERDRREFVASYRVGGGSNKNSKTELTHHRALRRKTCRDIRERNPPPLSLIITYIVNNHLSTILSFTAASVAPWNSVWHERDPCHGLNCVPHKLICWNPQYLLYFHRMEDSTIDKLLGNVSYDYHYCQLLQTYLKYFTLAPKLPPYSFPPTYIHLPNSPSSFERRTFLLFHMLLIHALRVLPPRG